MTEPYQIEGDEIRLPDGKPIATIGTDEKIKFLNGGFAKAHKEAVNEWLIQRTTGAEPAEPETITTTITGEKTKTRHFDYVGGRLVEVLR